ncbi:hypothetical protein PGT21_005899 [Puccinia graminis f. sp. tritici]|uniref:Uncharacterized protein n=1 Tax=Puccinia graminis f. sp. tritici TaxID=56615 RepID=A0A5B0QWW3_PUCGR|nr:hypothetical protein PGT21_005899 [Puccinia graminis f. sp. tritici]
MPKDIVVTLNLQHNCHDGKCPIKKTKMVQAERQDTPVRVQQVCHTDSKHYILNSVSFHESEEHRHMNNLIFHQIDSEDVVEAMSEGHLTWKAHCQKTMPRKKKKVGVRTGDDNQSCKPLVELSAISFGGKLESWSRVGERTDHAARFRSPNSGRFCWVNEIGLTTSVARERPTDSQTVLPTALQPTRSVNLGGWGGPQCTNGHITWPFSHCGPPHPPTNGLYRGWRIVVHPGWFHNHPPTENVARWCSVGKKSAPVPRRM